MYKVFVVDDEIVIREGIRNSFPWDQTPFSLVGEAPDGEIALSILQDVKPDILITDIRMPFMDGLSLSRIVTRTMPWIHIVILSGYDEFSYAREAISVGVCEYLLKPVSAKDLQTALERIAERILKERAEQENRDILRQRFETQARILQELLLNDLMSGAMDTESILSRARSLNLPLLSRCYAVMVFASKGNASSDQLTLMAHLRRLADGSDQQVHVCASGQQMLALVMGESEEDVDERAYAFAQAAKYEIERAINCTLSVAIGEIVVRIAKVTDSYHSAQRAMQHLGTLTVGKILSERDIKTDTSSLLMDLDVVPLNEQLKFATQEDMQAIISHYAKILGSTAIRSTLLSHYVFVEVLLAASRIIKENGGDPQKILPSNAYQEMIVGITSSTEEILSLCEVMLRKAIAFRAEKTDTRYGPVIQKACEYIGAHFTDPSITLQTVAKEVALSTSHFCTVFAQEMGATFIEYITSLRVERAKQLLMTTSMRSSDVAYSVGYNDPHYFSYLFKKHAGMTPRDYRNIKRM